MWTQASGSISIKHDGRKKNNKKQQINEKRDVDVQKKKNLLLVLLSITK